MGEIDNRHERARRLIRPEALSTSEPLFWSTGAGSDGWDLFLASIAGHPPAITSLLDKDPSLARAAYQYRPAIAFAVRENQPAAVALLLARGAPPTNSGTPDTLLEMARDRGHDEIERMLSTAIAGPEA